MPLHKEIATDPPPHESVGVQLVFDFTRTVILESAVVSVRRAQAIEIHGDPEAPWLVTATWRHREPMVLEFGPLSFLVRYAGEHLRPLGHVWLTLDQLGNVAGTVDPKKEIANWLNCRAKDARGDPAKKFFLALDSATHPALMTRLSKAGRQRRTDMVRGLMELLTSRLSLRKDAVAELVPPRDFIGPLNEASAIMRKALIAAYRPHPKEDKASAFDRFAAGLLVQQCPVTHPQLVKRLRNACDADGALVFLFAELALAVMQVAALRKASKRSRTEARFWKPLLNALVRMQKIYIERHVRDPKHPHDPRCFRDYGEPPRAALDPAIMQNIVAEYQAKTPEEILQAVKSHAEHVHSRADCFGP